MAELVTALHATSVTAAHTALSCSCLRAESAMPGRVWGTGMRRWRICNRRWRSRPATRSSLLRSRRPRPTRARRVRIPCWRAACRQTGLSHSAQRQRRARPRGPYARVCSAQRRPLKRAELPNILGRRRRAAPAGLLQRAGPRHRARSVWVGRAPMRSCRAARKPTVPMRRSGTW